jgi:methyl-accepting chemotaxis protein
MVIRKHWFLSYLVISLFLLNSTTFTSAEELKGFDKQVEIWASECRQEILTQFEILLSSGKLTTGQLFDTFYIPIPDTSPQQYRTQYDKYCDQTIRRIIDFYLEKDKRLIFVAPVDRNGYLPTHNSRFSQPLSGDPEIDAKKNRTKRMFNDRTGLAAARNTTDCLLQQYQRDTGETLYDLSLPIFIHKQHWGAIRVGYRK